ncbi:hypothetical protein RHMOL_Rhmol06G0310100 [Rhododendron molle]|uniref:Uncharacterized protein n=1 Tax=Rhododendron molle TaxID=49168 RepID=A0ACC0NK78_RHOML|nr:hypothetical protein RHMOL_Rhmol06G0310100 [Rhododendron molle]
MTGEEVVGSAGPKVVRLLYFVGAGFQKSKANNSTSDLPPRPGKLPLIGNLHQIASSLPHLALRDLAKKHGPLMSLQLGEVLAIVVSSPEMAKEVMKTHDIIFASRPHIIATRIVSYDSTNLTFAPYGLYWRQLQKICTTELLSRQCVLSGDWCLAVLPTAHNEWGGPKGMGEFSIMLIFSRTVSTLSRQPFHSLGHG